MHICRELELSGLDNYSQLVAVKDQNILSMTTVLHTLLPENCFSKTFAMDFIIYDWVPPPPEALFKCLQINCNLKIIAAVNQAVATRVLDISHFEKSYFLNYSAFFKAILFTFGRSNSEFLSLKKIVLNDFTIENSDEKNLAEVFIQLLDFLEEFDVGNFTVTDSFLNYLTVSSMKNLTELCLKKGNFRMETLINFLRKLTTNLKKLDLFNIDWIEEPEPITDFVDIVCRKFSIVCF